MDHKSIGESIDDCLDEATSIIKSMPHLLCMGLGVAVFTNTIFYLAVPSHVYLYSGGVEEDDLTRDEAAATSIGFITGLTAAVYQANIYYNHFMLGDIKVAAIPLVTNIGGLLGQYAYNRLTPRIKQWFEKPKGDHFEAYLLKKYNIDLSIFD